MNTPRNFSGPTPVLAALACLCLTVATADAQSDRAVDAVDFNRQIRPILAENCFKCHGPDAGARQADLRLDTRGGATRSRTHGAAIRPDHPEESLLIEKVSADKPAHRMPPAETGKRLSPHQIDLLRRWIDQGARYDVHWSFVPPERSEPPKVRQADWPRNDIDRFILAKLEREGLTPSPEASRETLIRRLSFDLNGLPPTLEEVDTFLADRSEDAFERLVDRLLASPRYGERMAMPWLDGARYADTNGYHIDNERFMWPWRDWVIGAFNDDMPFDQFTVEQLAGDLLPDATRSQIIATGFNRNHMINFEGGAIPEEYQTEYVIDRVNTTSTVWMGLTMECARCHDHKYDPITQKEFYEFYAFFNTVSEKGLDGQKGNAAPFFKAPSKAQEEEIDALRARVTDLTQRLDGPMPDVDERQRDWQHETEALLADRWQVIEPVSMESTGESKLTRLADGSIFAEGPAEDREDYEIVARVEKGGITAVRLEALTDDRLPHRGPGRADNANFVLTEFTVEVAPLNGAGPGWPVPWATAHADHAQSGFDVHLAIDDDAASGWAIEGFNLREDRVAVFVPRVPFGFERGSELRVRLAHQSKHSRHSIGRFRLSISHDAALFQDLAPSTMGVWHSIGPFQAADGKEAYQKAYPPEQGVDLQSVHENGSLSWTARPEYVDAAVHTLTGENAATYLHRTIHAPTARLMTLSLGSDDAIKVWLNAQLVLDKDVLRGVAPDQEELTIQLDPGENALLMKIVNYAGGYGFYFDVRKDDSATLPMDVGHILSIPPALRLANQVARLRNHFRGRHSPVWQELNQELVVLREEEADLDARIPTTMVMDGMEEPRETFVLERGQYDQPAESISAGVPACLPALPQGSNADRLGLARWLVDPAHPLTARVAVNRFWQMIFGTGLVETSENLGMQGAWPSHPELLDWLAVSFREDGWDVKKLLSRIVTSATYRQSSNVSAPGLERDPKNRLLSRGPRFRLPAEMVRDNALALSGLLAERVGGRSVRPYQPEGLWEDVAYEPSGKTYSAQSYVVGEGDDLYRRSMYTFWKRSAPPPGMTIFDAPKHEICTVRRSTTNTPLQALILLNDPTFLEAARVMGQRILREGGDTQAARADFAFRLATARYPSSQERGILLDIYAAQLEAYIGDLDAARALISIGESPNDPELDPARHAAWTMVASVILNLDETITKS